MTRYVKFRGAAPVGHVADLDPLDAAAILYLRLWCDGPGGQGRVRTEFTETLGPAAGRKAVEALDALCDLCARFGRRPILRHQPQCLCLGADEACLTNLVAQATEGDREDALLIATLIVRPDVSLHLAAAAQTFGLALKRVALAKASRDERGADPWTVAPAPPRTVH